MELTLKGTTERRQIIPTETIIQQNRIQTLGLERKDLFNRIIITILNQQGQIPGTPAKVIVPAEGGGKVNLQSMMVYR